MTKHLHKKGMSPLIATILLITFAVSIGVTLMNFGGLYYQERLLGEPHCSKVAINAFELIRNKECMKHESGSIFNFYLAKDIVSTPECYRGVVTGNGKLCFSQNLFFNFSQDLIFNGTWRPAKEAIR